MEAAELLIRYRKLGLKKRIFIVAGISFSLVAYFIVDQSAQLEGRLVQANQEKMTMQQKLTKSIQKEKELPELEKRLYRLVDELEKTKKIIPDHFPIDQILQKTAITAQDVDVKMEEFVPGTPVPSTTQYRYASLPIQIHVLGSYAKIVAFIDKIVHWPITVHVTNFKLSLVDILVESPNPDSSNIKNDSTKISATMDMVLYRSLSNMEIAVIQKQEAKTKAPIKKKGTN